MSWGTTSFGATCPYALLGLPTTASDIEIKRAYRLSLDRLRAAADSAARDASIDHLDAARWAYRLLSDAEQRQRYDAERLAGLATTERPAVAAAAGEHSASFHGTGKVYARIWITNLLLSLLTLGIYSAWAKVRREQYFHRHLRIDGVGFDYHGDPRAILRGRIIFFLVLAAYSLTRYMPSLLAASVTLGAVLLFPWMVVRSLQFRAANTSYRGLRFSFRGRYREALAAYLGYGLLTLLSCGIALPLMMWRQKQFLLCNLGYGTRSFGCHATRRMFYKALWLPTLVLFALLAGPTLALIFFGKSLLFVVGALLASKILVPWLVLVVLLVSVLVMPYARMVALNLAWSNTHLDGARFICRQRFIGFGATQLSNWLLMILSLGLFWPWAVTRIIHYRANHFAIDASESLDEFIAGRQASTSALGGEAATALDMEVGL